MRHILLILLLCVLAPAGVLAADGAKEQPAVTATKTEKTPEKTPEEKPEKKTAKKAEKKAEDTKPKKPRLQDSPVCYKMGEEVREMVSGLGRCWKDLDCTSVSLGCPWQLSPCHQTLISLSEPEKNHALAEKLKEYQKTCVDPDAPYAAACKEFNAKVEGSACQTMFTMCVSGKCMTQIDAIMQDPDMGKKFEAGRIAPDDILKQRP